jgi:hypothetical protein
MHSWHTTHQPQRHAGALRGLRMQFSVNQYFTLRVHLPTEMKPRFVAKQNDCDVYLSITCSFWQLVGVQYVEDQHRPVFEASVTIHRSIMTGCPLDVFVSYRRPDATLSHAAQNSEPSRVLKSPFWCEGVYKHDDCRNLFDNYYISLYILKNNRVTCLS